MNFALVAARRERWARIPLDHIHEGGEALASTGDDADPQSRMLHAEAVATIREATERHLTEKQQQALRAVVFEQVPLDEVARHWGSNRNAVYKLLHDARRELKRHLLSRGLDVNGILDLFAGAR